MKNYGIDLIKEDSEQDGTEYLAAALPICKASAMDKFSIEELTQYFPKGEIQRSNYDDMMDCASRDGLNFLETKYNYLLRNGLLSNEQIKFAYDAGYIIFYDGIKDGIKPNTSIWYAFIEKYGWFEFSDAFIAIKSGTTKQGNSLKAPLQAIHDFGLIPKQIMPLESWMRFEDYHNPERITPAIELLGQKWKEIMGEIFYGQETDYNKHRGLVTAVYAWEEPVEGVYKRVNNNFFNHAVYRPLPQHYVYDNYIDSADGDFIKHLTPDFNFYQYGYSIVIGDPKVTTTVAKSKKNWFIDFTKRLFSFFNIQYV